MRTRYGIGLIGVILLPFAAFMLNSTVGSISAVAQGRTDPPITSTPAQTIGTATRELQERMLGQKRVALVVGNSAYSDAARLENPVSDARAVAAALEKLSFDVLLHMDLDQRSFAHVLTRFSDKLRAADVGLFYFAGHGVQFSGRNYLLSRTATLDNEFLIPAEGMELSWIVREMEKNTAVNIVLVDACRNNPFAERLRAKNPARARSIGLTRGLARIDTKSPGTLIGFATAANEIAEDGIGSNSPFTRALIKHIETPNIEISAMLKRVTNDVKEATNGRQRPEVVSSMTAEFYFRVLRAGSEVAASEPSPVAQTDSVKLRSADLLSVEAQAALKIAQSLNTIPAYQVVIENYSDTPQSQLAKAAISKLEAEQQREEMVVTSVMPGVTAPGGTAAEERELNLSLEDRKGVQIVLSALGYDTRGIDGQFGPGTRDAIRKYQYANQHEPTGFLSRDEFAAIASNQEKVRKIVSGRAFALSAKDLPIGSDNRLVQAVRALRGYPIRFGMRAGTLYIAVLNFGRFDEARSLAKAAGGDLAIIESAQENKFIFDLVATDERFWLLEREPGSTTGYYAHGPMFGLYQSGNSRSSAQGWTWVNNKSPSYTNWDPSGEPNAFKIYRELGVGVFGGDAPQLAPFAKWQDRRLLEQSSPGFIIEIPERDAG